MDDFQSGEGHVYGWLWDKNQSFTIKQALLLDPRQYVCVLVGILFIQIQVDGLWICCVWEGFVHVFGGVCEWVGLMFVNMDWLGSKNEDAAAFANFFG